jgi:transcription elongation factor Elf1
MANERHATAAVMYATDGPTCPYCRHVENDLEEFHYSQDTTALTCGACDKEYVVEVEVCTSWTSRPLLDPRELVEL